MSEQLHARGAHVTKLNPAWVWPPSAATEEPPTEPPPSGPELVDSWPIGRMDTPQGYGLKGEQGWTQVGAGQVIIGTGATLHAVEFAMLRLGAPAITFALRLYEAAGTPALDAHPAGPILAESAALDPAVLSDVESTLFRFELQTQVALEAGRAYAVVLELLTGVTDDLNGIFVGADMIPVGPKPLGNLTCRDLNYLEGAWYGNPNALTAIYYIYGTP